MTLARPAALAALALLAALLAAPAAAQQLYGPLTPRTWTSNPYVKNDSRPLFQYAASNDPAYGWQEVGAVINGTFPSPWTGYFINLTSQNWLTPADVDRTLWFHTLLVIVPAGELVTQDTMAMYITGGEEGDSFPSATDEDVLVTAYLACQARAMGAVLFQVPAAPIVFATDPNHVGRTEDSLIAWSWFNFFADQSRPELIAELPMTKSAVAAVDALQDFAKQKFGYSMERFIIAGASKRGWTTWLHCAVDSRCVAAIPIVMDMLNFDQAVAHMYRSYGGWTFAFEPYWVTNLTEQINLPNMYALQAIVDPLQYADTLTMPKLVVDSTGDEFFMPDDDWFWWGQLQGETFRLMMPNAEHTCVTGLLTLLPSAAAFVTSVILDAPRPQLSWTIDRNLTDPYSTGRIVMTTQTQPDKVILWSATTFDGNRRDFRLIKGNTPADPCEFIPVPLFGSACINPVLWAGESIQGQEDGGVYTYIGEQPLPDVGWRGFLLEVHFPGPAAGMDYIFTTQVSIIPNTFPFEACGSGVACKGVLV